MDEAKDEHAEGNDSHDAAKLANLVSDFSGVGHGVERVEHGAEEEEQNWDAGTSDKGSEPTQIELSLLGASGQTD